MGGVCVGGCIHIYTYIPLYIYLQWNITQPQKRMEFAETWMDLGIIILLFFFWPCHTACRILVSQPDIEPTPSALEAWSLSHWTTREEIIMLSEVRQRKTNFIQYHLNMESKKMTQINLFTKQKQPHR